jgi:hypothetical protein
MEAVKETTSVAETIFKDKRPLSANWLPDVSTSDIEKELDKSRRNVGSGGAQIVEKELDGGSGWSGG